MGKVGGWANDSGHYGEPSLEKLGHHDIQAEKLEPRGAKKSYGGGFNTKSEKAFIKAEFHDGTKDSYEGREIKGKKLNLKGE